MPTLGDAFWTKVDALIAGTQVVIDRPCGSAHPRYPSLVYPLDYGYLANTSGGDGGGIDVWRGSIPNVRCDAVLCTIDMMKRDMEVKLLIACTHEEKALACAFHNNSDLMSAVIVERESKLPR